MMILFARAALKASTKVTIQFGSERVLTFGLLVKFLFSFLRSLLLGAIPFFRAR
jgi:hypothetical protein